MLLLLLSACIENSLRTTPDRVGDTDPVVEVPDTDPADTDAPIDTDPVDTDAPDTDAPDTDPPVDTDAPIDTGAPEDTDPPEPDGTIVVSGECRGSGYPFTSWSDPSAVAPELHVVGMYESNLGSPGPADVTVRRTSAMVLALTSYEPVDWQVDLGATTGVTKIIVANYDGASTVTFTSAATAPVTTTAWIGACAYEIPDMAPTSGCETPDLQAILETRTGLAMSSFQGCYAGGEFLID